MRPEEVAQGLYSALSEQGRVRVVGERNGAESGRVQVRDDNGNWVDIPEQPPGTVDEQIVLNRRVRPQGGQTTAWCMAWVWRYSPDANQSQNRYTVYFRSSASQNAIAIIQLDNDGVGQSADTVRHDFVSVIGLSIVSQNSFVVEVSYQRLRYEVIGTDFLGEPIYSQKIDEFQKGVFIQGQTVTVIRNHMHTQFDDPERPLPDTTQGNTKYLTNYVAGNAFNFYDPTQGAIDLSTFDQNTVTLIPRSYFGKFARYKPLAPDPAYTNPPPGKGWVNTFPLWDSLINGSIYTGAIALTGTQIQKLRTYALSSASGNSIYSLSSASVDFLENQLNSKWPTGENVLGIPFVGNNFCFRALRASDNPTDVVYPSHNIDNSFVQPLLTNVYLSDLVFILAELQETVKVEIYNIPTSRSLNPTGNTDISFGRKVATVQIPLTDTNLQPANFGDRLQGPIRGGLGGGLPVVFKVAVFET